MSSHQPIKNINFIILSLKINYETFLFLLIQIEQCPFNKILDLLTRTLPHRLSCFFEALRNKIFSTAQKFISKFILNTTCIDMKYAPSMLSHQIVGRCLEILLHNRPNKLTARLITNIELISCSSFSKINY